MKMYSIFLHHIISFCWRKTKAHNEQNEKKAHTLSTQLSVTLVGPPLFAFFKFLC
jgi:hypothetical protein